MTSLANVLRAVDWNTNVSDFLKSSNNRSRLTQGCRHIAVFAHELSFQDMHNKSLPFLQEMKASTTYVPACLALGLVKPAASAMRAAVENALYFSYFRAHDVELETLLRDPKYYLSKKRILDFHLQHTPDFSQRSAKVGFSDRLDNWYSKISAIVHGQIPGVWSSTSIGDTVYNADSTEQAILTFEDAVRIIRYLFLLTTPIDVWEAISPSARQIFLKTVPKAHKEDLALAIV